MTKTLRSVFAVAIAIGAAAPIAQGADYGVKMSDQVGLSLAGSIHLCNNAETNSGSIEVTAFLPTNQVGQIVYDLEFIPKPNSVSTDRWGQQIATWRVKRLDPGEHRFFIWVARLASFDVRFDLERLRKGDLLLPRRIRDDYIWGNNLHAGFTDSYFDRYQNLTAYVRRSAPQMLSGLPFDTAAGCPASPEAEAAFLTRLACANDIPCRTVGAYFRAVGADFSIDEHGTAWNEIYFPQSGWVPTTVSDPRRAGHKPNNTIVVKAAGYDPDDASGLWGAVSGAGHLDSLTRRGYSARARDLQEKGDLVQLFNALARENDPDKIARMLMVQGQTGDSMVIPLVEPYLYHKQPAVVQAAAAAIGSIRHGMGALVLIDAIGQLPEADPVLIKHAESLTGVSFGANKSAWRSWIRANLHITPK